MSATYPERRPYATTVPHSGYLSKPTLPPVEALRILSSTVGIDLPRSVRHSANTLLRRSPTPRSVSPTRGVQLFKPPTLETATPFEFQEKDYHKSQQSVLNVQLSNAVEELFKVWRVKVRDLMHYLDSFPCEAGHSFSRTNGALSSFFEGYRTTDITPMTAHQLVNDFKLCTSVSMLDEIQNSPEVLGDQVRAALDALLNAKHFLAPLENFVDRLEPIAAFALPDKRPECLDGTRGPVWPSKVAVALHEKFHYDPSEYVLAELRKSDQPIERLENRVLQVKERKEDAIDREIPGDALNYLTTQVDLSNDLLLMNKARMELVYLHGKDIQEMKRMLEDLIVDARHSVELLKGRVERDMPLVKKDIDGVYQDVENTQKHIKELDQKNAEANKAAHEAYSKLNDTEVELWVLLTDTIRKLVDIAGEKEAFVRNEMRLRELRGRDMAIAEELLAAQQSYFSRLRKSEDVLKRWENAAETYEAYVQAYVPTLLKKIHDAEEADKDLYNREAQNYVRRYEMFEYAVEEGRATRSVHVDRLQTLQRSKLLDVERALSTLDPFADKYRKELDEAQAQLDEGLAFIQLVENLAKERRGEVEPILQHVISYNRTLQTKTLEIEAEAEAQALLLRDGPATEGAPSTMNTVDAKVDTSLLQSARGSSGKRPATAAVSEVTHFSDAPPTSAALRLRSVVDANNMMCTVSHPHVMARTVGINHEEAFLEKYRRFTDEEQVAVEGVAGRVRQSNTSLEMLGEKYNNKDYIRMLLLSPGAKQSNSATEAAVEECA